MRRILREYRLTVHPERSSEGSDKVRLVVAGPSDNGSSPFKNRQVVAFEWRSPSGDDLFLEIPFREFIRALYGLPQEVMPGA